MADLLLWIVFEFCNAWKICENRKEWRAARRQCGGAAKWKGNRRWEKNALLLGCLSRRWKYHGLGVRQGFDSVSVTWWGVERWYSDFLEANCTLRGAWSCGFHVVSGCCDVPSALDSQILAFSLSCASSERPVAAVWLMMRNMWTPFQETA